MQHSVKSGHLYRNAVNYKLYYVTGVFPHLKNKTTPTMLKDTYTLVAIRDKKKILISDESQLRYYLLDYRHTVAMYDLTTKQLVLANPGTANTPIYITINGQHMVKVESLLEEVLWIQLKSFMLLL